MSIFGNKKKAELPPLVLTDEPEADPVNYNSVLDYLVGLSNRDYDKLCKVAAIYRTANKDAAKVLGIKDEPTSVLAEHPETTEAAELPDIDAELDNELQMAFLEDEPKKPVKKVTVKDDNKA